MRVIDHSSQSQLDQVTLMLNESECTQMIGYLEQLLAGPVDDHHHLSCEDYKREITLAKFDQKSTEFLDAHTRSVVLGD